MRGHLVSLLPSQLGSSDNYWGGTTAGGSLMGPDFLKTAYQLFPGKHTMYEVKFMRHAEVAPGCDGTVAQREDPGLLHHTGAPYG